MEDIEEMFSDAFEVIFQILFNVIGASVRWLFFLGQYSFSSLRNQRLKNILVALLVWLMLLGGGGFLLFNKISINEKQEQEISNISIS
ncbi:hypothetical protein ACE193_22065 [Bernardetia sp. OM2101]|uniref:hypothetical protein n=1 Tax=Bernardetia sp. OM2101 TaxID=3344876 RepID=UPI0035D04152